MQRKHTPSRRGKGTYSPAPSQRAAHTVLPESPRFAMAEEEQPWATNGELTHYGRVSPRREEPPSGTHGRLAGRPTPHMENVVVSDGDVLKRHIPLRPTPGRLLHGDVSPGRVPRDAASAQHQHQDPQLPPTEPQVLLRGSDDAFVVVARDVLSGLENDHSALEALRKDQLRQHRGAPAPAQHSVNTSAASNASATSAFLQRQHHKAPYHGEHHINPADRPIMGVGNVSTASTSPPQHEKKRTKSPAAAPAPPPVSAVMENAVLDANRAALAAKQDAAVSKQHAAGLGDRVKQLTADLHDRQKEVGDLRAALAAARADAPVAGAAADKQHAAESAHHAADAATAHAQVLELTRQLADSTAALQRMQGRLKTAEGAAQQARSGQRDDDESRVDMRLQLEGAQHRVQLLMEDQQHHAVRAAAREAELIRQMQALQQQLLDQQQDQQQQQQAPIATMRPPVQSAKTMSVGSRQSSPPQDRSQQASSSPPANDGGHATRHLVFQRASRDSSASTGRQPLQMAPVATRFVLPTDGNAAAARDGKHHQLPISYDGSIAWSRRIDGDEVQF
jgi:hypothetical protein